MSQISDQRLRQLMQIQASIVRIDGISPQLRAVCADTVIALGELISLRDSHAELARCIDAMVAKTMEA